MHRSVAETKQNVPPLCTPQTLHVRAQPEALSAAVVGVRALREILCARRLRQRCSQASAGRHRGVVDRRVELKLRERSDGAHARTSWRQPRAVLVAGGLRDVPQRGVEVRKVFKHWGVHQEIALALCRCAQVRSVPVTCVVLRRDHLRRRNASGRGKKAACLCFSQKEQHKTQT